MIPLILHLAAIAIAYFGYRLSNTSLCVPVFVFAVFVWIVAGRLGEIEKR